MLLIPRPLTLGGLDCVLFAPPDGRAAGLGVFCHGFGAPGDDLVPLGAEILGAPGTEALALLFPAAPVSLAAEGMPGGRAWWPLDMSRLQTGAPLDAQEMAGRELPGSAEAAAVLARRGDGLRGAPGPGAGPRGAGRLLAGGDGRRRLRVSAQAPPGRGCACCRARLWRWPAGGAKRRRWPAGR